MKVIPIALATHLAGGTTSVAHLLLITRTDGEVFGFTSASDDVELSGVVYSASPGLNVTNVVINAGLAVDNLELMAFNDETIFTNVAILTSVWSNAAFLISRYNWASPSDGLEAMLAGTIGNVTLRESMVVCELRGLTQYFQQTIADVTSKTCRARLGDAKCRVDLAPFTFTATVTSLAFIGGDVPSLQIFAASALVQADDYFGAGELEWLTGDNAGLRVLVKTSGSTLVTLMLPMLLAIQVGDTFSIIAGCRKRLQEDCRDKFDNVLNFQGEPHLPGVDAVLASPS